MTNTLGEFRMTEEQVRLIAAQAASQAVRETLLRLGVPVDDPMEMQRDMQHLRAWRSSVESIRNKSLTTIVGIAVTGFVALVVVGLRDYFSR
jgi:hypothetical protein